MGPGDLVDDSTPEDVAALYRWAGLTGAKYRDYSAERREQRAKMRQRTAKERLETDLAARVKTSETSAEKSGEKNEGARLADAAARAVLRAMEEEREIAEAHESARRKDEAAAEAERLLQERSGAAVRKSVVRGNRISEQTLQLAGVRESAGEAARTSAFRPAWLDAASGGTIGEGVSASASAELKTVYAATLLDSREQVALRWPALQALAQELRRSVARAPMSARRGPVVAVVAPSGGSGATSLAAALARTLANRGERVLLVEAAGKLLQLYFGVGGIGPGEIRTIAPREGESGSVSLYVTDVGAAGPDPQDRSATAAREKAVEDLLGRAQGLDRIVIDLAPDTVWLVRGLAALRPMVLASVAPEMGAVAGIATVEQTFAAFTDSDGRALLPFYVLNRFDAGLPLHLDIREVLRRELGERLLHTAVRRAAEVGEALAEGKTVVDYAPDAAVTRECAEVARWLRDRAPASAEAIEEAARGVR